MKGDIPLPFSKEGYKSPDPVEHNIVHVFGTNNSAQTQEENHRVFEDKLVLPMNPVDVSHEPNNSTTESEDIVRAVKKIKKVVDRKKIKTPDSKSRGVTKRKKKDKNKFMEDVVELVEEVVEPRSKYVKGPNFHTKKRKGDKPCMRSLVDYVSLQDWEHLFKWIVSFLHEPEVCESYYKMLLNDDGSIDTQIHEVDIHLYHESIILEVPCKRVGSVEGCVPSDSYVKSVVKKSNLPIILSSILQTLPEMPSLSTPVCGVSKTGESTTPTIEVLLHQNVDPTIQPLSQMKTSIVLPL
ncbi:hypothetical protein H5410_055814 [Solanum commersonii]|uniref:Uncharacterized protein n=1 Tax=Solanum commersonii TaxID=4109 RepID=A0A9J5WKX1_SOLCO|nr:hypothetical protein H5410_055814 [Solanum commersonii]